MYIFISKRPIQDWGHFEGSKMLRANMVILCHVFYNRISVYQLLIKAYEKPVIKSVWTNSKEENTPISVWLVSDNGITEAFGEYRDIEGDQNILFALLLYMEAEEISYSEITRNETEKNSQFEV